MSCMCNDLEQGRAYDGWDESVERVTCDKYSRSLFGSSLVFWNSHFRVEQCYSIQPQNDYLYY